MSNDQILLLNSRRKRNQSIEAAMASISNLMNTFAKDEGETSTITDFREDRDKSSTERVNNEEEFLDQFNLPPNTSMARQDTFGEVQQSSNVLATERLSLPGFASWSLKSNDTILNDTYYSLDRGPSFDYESNALVREAKRVSIKKSPTIKRSPNIDVLRKSFSCGNLRSRTTTTETYDSFLHNQMLTNNLPILNLARHTRDSSFSISSPETVLTSYFSDTEDFETPESPIFHHTHEEAFSTTPTLRQIRNGFHYDQVPNIESVSAFKIKPLTLSLPPKPKSEAIKKILRERVASSNNNEDKIINHTFGNTAMRYQHSEPISEAERLIQNYFADTNLMRQHLYNEYSTIAQQPHQEPEEKEKSKEILSSDTEVLLDISTGGWGGRYSTGEEVPPLLYHESSEEYFREQLTAMKAEDEEDAERIDSNKTPTDEFQPNILPRLSSKDYSKELGMPTQQEHSESTTALQVQVRKGNKAVPPVIPPKSPHRPQTMLKSASHSLDLKSRPAITHLDENHHPLKRRDFVNEGFKESAHLTPHKPHMLRSSRSENALDRHYNSGHDDNPSSLEDERTNLTLSRLGFHSNKRNHKFHRLYKSNQAYTGSDEDLGFSTNVTPSSHRSSRLIRSVAALKSLSKRITSRKSQSFDFSQKIQSNKEVTGINPDQSTQSNLPNNFDSDTQRNGSLSPFQQVYARAWPIKKASKSPMAVANKMQNYF